MRLFVLAAGVGLLVPGCGDPPCYVTVTCERLLEGGGGSGAAGGSGAGGAPTGGSGGEAERLADGEACNAAAQCTSGQCVDAVCCASACDAICMSCNVAGAEGMCTADAAGDDPASDCGMAACDGNGACSFGEHRWVTTTTPTDGNIPALASAAFVSNGSLWVYGDLDAYSGNPNDFQLRRYTPSGTLSTTKSFGGTGPQLLGFDVLTITPGDEIVFAGGYTPPVDFGGVSLPGVAQRFVARLDSEGDGVWAEGYFGGNGTSHVPLGVAVDSAGNVVIAGRYGGTGVNYGGSDLPSAGLSDGFVASYQPNGDHRWSFSWGAPDQDWAEDVIALGDDTVVLGSFPTDITIDGTMYTANGSRDSYLVRLDPSGSVVWSKQLDAPDIQGMEVAPNDRFVVYGSFSGTLSFGGADLVSASPNDDDWFVAMFDGDGNHVWSRSWGGLLDDSLSNVRIDALGHIVMLGFTRDAIDFGGGELVTSGMADTVLAKVDADGNYMWARIWGNDLGTTDAASSLAVAGDGDIAVMGRFEGTITLGGESFTATDPVRDMYVWRLGP